jgi:4a-hydroxytetrahydrobiopterin dehydratase
MKLERTKMTWDQIEPRLTELPGWTVTDGELTKTFEFPTYLDGVTFAHEVAQVAEGLDHHPDLLISYRKVTVSVNTHDAGGLTAYDFELARRVQLLS